MRRIAVVDAPSNLGLRPPTATSVPGCAKAPGSLRDSGLLARLGARDAGCITPPRYDPAGWEPGDGVAQADEIAVFVRRLADRIGTVLASGDFPVVLGGDCSILLGAGLAMRRYSADLAGRVGLVYVDGHSDFRHEGNASYVGAAAGEALALATGRGQSNLASIEQRRPYFRDVDVVLLGIRTHDEYRLDLQAAGIVARAVPELRSHGAARSAQWARDQLRDCTGFWVHVDVDVLDPAVMPAVDAPDVGGIAYRELEILLSGLVCDPRCVGVQVTVFDPDYDPDGQYAREVTDVLVAGLEPLVTSSALAAADPAPVVSAPPLQTPAVPAPAAPLERHVDDRTAADDLAGGAIAVRDDSADLDTEWAAGPAGEDRAAAAPAGTDPPGEPVAGVPGGLRRGAAHDRADGVAVRPGDDLPAGVRRGAAHDPAAGLLGDATRVLPGGAARGPSGGLARRPAGALVGDPGDDVARGPSGGLAGDPGDDPAGDLGDEGRVRVQVRDGADGRSDDPARGLTSGLQGDRAGDPADDVARGPSRGLADDPGDDDRAGVPVRDGADDLSEDDARAQTRGLAGRPAGPEGEPARDLDDDPAREPVAADPPALAADPPALAAGEPADDPAGASASGTSAEVEPASPDPVETPVNATHVPPEVRVADAGDDEAPADAELEVQPVAWVDVRTGAVVDLAADRGTGRPGTGRAEAPRLPAYSRGAVIGITTRKPIDLDAVEPAGPADGGWVTVGSGGVPDEPAADTDQGGEQGTEDGGTALPFGRPGRKGRRAPRLALTLAPTSAPPASGRLARRSGQQDDAPARDRLGRRAGQHDDAPARDREGVVPFVPAQGGPPRAPVEPPESPLTDVVPAARTPDEDRAPEQL